MEENKPVKRRPVLLIVALGFFGIAAMAGLMFWEMKSGVSGDYNATLYLTAKGLNMTCPRMLDNGIRLDSVTAKRDVQLHYFYTLTTSEISEYDSAAFCEEYEKGITDNLAGSADLEEFGKHNVTMVFNMSDKNGELMCSILFTPQKYYDSLLPSTP